MVGKILSMILGFVFLINYPSGKSAFAETVETIYIQSNEKGWGERKCDYKIIRTDNGYKEKVTLLDPSSNIKELIQKGVLKPDFESINKKLSDQIMNDKRVFDDIDIKKEVVSNLVLALQANPVKELDFGQFGITEKWLTTKAEAFLNEELKKYSSDEFPNLKSKRGHLLETLTNLPNSIRKLKRYYAYGWTDDHPDLKVTIIFANGKKIILTSEDQHAFMIPWEIQKNQNSYQTYDIRISQALGPLLHSKCANYKRVNVNLADLFRQRIWEDPVYFFRTTLSSEKALEDQILPLTKDFLIQESYIATEYGPNGGRDVWRAKLKNKNWPLNIFVNFSTVVNGKKLDFTGFSAKKIEKYVQHILSIPWLKNFINDNPFYTFSIGYEKGYSIAQRRYNWAIKNLEKKHDFKWGSLDPSYSDEIVYLNVVNEVYGDSGWLIFPDKTMILANSRGSEILKWHTNNVDIGPGSRVSPSGELIHP
jgi:hypothetical protein